MQKITFATNTGPNTLEYTKLLLKSLKENLSSREHEIIVFIDADNDGTYEYMKSIKSEFFDLKIVTHSVKPVIGYQLNSNIIVDLAKHDIVSYLQSDMIVSKNYDIEILQDLEENCILSSTRIEPPLHGQSSLTFIENFGLSPEQFRWLDFLNFAETVKSNRIEDYFFAPFTFYKKTWQSIGGYDSLFRRSREDSDFVQRCVHNGIKLKQTFKANVYHFTCVSSRGKNWFDTNNLEAKKRLELQNTADQIEMRRFIKKWGAFNHGEKKLHKLDMDLVVKDCNKIDLGIIMQLEPFFSRVWLDSQEAMKKIEAYYDNQHAAANSLLNFEKKDWDFAKRFFNQLNFNDIYFFGDPKEFNIRIDMKVVGIDLQNDELVKNIIHLYDILSSSEGGVYELGSSRIEVKHVVDLSNNNKIAKNPHFDHSLLNIQ